MILPPYYHSMAMATKQYNQVLHNKFLMDNQPVQHMVDMDKLARN